MQKTTCLTLTHDQDDWEASQKMCSKRIPFQSFSCGSSSSSSRTQQSLHKASLAALNRLYDANIPWKDQKLDYGAQAFILSPQASLPPSTNNSHPLTFPSSRVPKEFLLIHAGTSQWAFSWNTAAKNLKTEGVSGQCGKGQRGGVSAVNLTLLAAPDALMKTLWRSFEWGLRKKTI